MIEHLLFSTRGARPASGSEFNREVVAASPGVPEAARAAFVKLADMTGAVLARPELPPLWAFRRLDEESWLVVRAVSLGLYRKGHHQLLVHGVVLPRETVDLLDGDPFLLASEEAAAAGFRFVEEHPEGREELPPLTLDPGFAGTARRLSVERLERLTEGLRELDPAFPALFDRVLGTGEAERRPVAVAPGSPAVVEWLLLHLHPADRAELSFHTRYAYEQAIPFDLVGAAPDEVADLRRRLRGEVDVWTPEAVRSPAPDGDGTEPTLGERVRQARERAPGLLPRTLEAYYLTLLPGRHGTDLRRNPFHPLEPEEADACLRAELGLPLDAEETELVERLALRGDRSLARHAADLAEAWRRGPAAFEDHLGRLTNAADELRRLDLDRMPPVARPEERLGLLALLPVLLPGLLDEGGSGVEDRLPVLWREVVPPGSTFADLLGRLRSPEEAEIGERVVGPWVAGLLRTTDEATAATAWPEYLRWLGAAGRPVAPVAARVEQALGEHPEPTALDGYRRLEKVCAEAGLAAFALRILFQREVPRLAPAAARVRLADGVGWLLRESGEGTAADPFLGPALADPEAAGVVLGALADRLMASDEPEARWPRVQRLLGAQPRAILPRAAAPAAGAFVARLALSPLAERAAEAVDRLDALGPDGSGGTGPVEDRFRFRDQVTTAAAAAIGDALHGRPATTEAGHAARGVAGLLALRLEERPLGEPDRALDRALLDALLPALVLSGPESDGGARLRTYVDRYLDRLLDLYRLHEVADPAGPWRHLLLDEIEAAPAPDPGSDPRHRAALHLAWTRWTTAAEHPGRSARTPATLALARAITASRPSRPDPHTHRALLERTVPRPHHPEAHHLLATLLPAAARL